MNYMASMRPRMSFGRRISRMLNLELLVIKSVCFKALWLYAIGYFHIFLIIITRGIIISRKVEKERATERKRRAAFYGVYGF